MTTRPLPISLLAGCLVALIATRTASADDKAACLDAVDQGQKLRSAHKLLEARDKFRLCAAAACPAVLQTDCAGWLASVENVLPSVVVTAKDGAGASVVDVTVTVDGKPFATRLSGEADSIDPGPHTFHFEAPGGITRDQVVVAAEGDQNQRVVVVLGGKAAGGAAAGTSASAAGATAGATAGPASSPWRTTGWAVGALGLAGLGVGTVSGVLAITDHNAADCSPSNVCLTGHLNDARSAATVSNVAFVAGSVLLATGVGLVLFAPAPASKERPVTTASVAPVLAGGGGGLVVAGTFR